MSNLDLMSRIALGEEAGLLTGYNFGKNPNVSNSVLETVWEVGDLYPYFDAQTLSAVSSSTDDDLGGPGAQKIMFTGLDANFDFLIEVVDLDGTNAVTTTKEFLRMPLAKIVGVDEQADNVGTITLTAGATTIGTILPQANRTQMAITTVPRNFTFLLLRTRVASASSQRIEFKYVIREPGDVFQIMDIPMVMDQEANTPRLARLRVPEKSDVELRSISASGNAIVTGGFEYMLVNNNLFEVRQEQLVP